MKRKEFTAGNCKHQKRLFSCCLFDFLDDEEMEEECTVDIVIRVKELDDVLMKDVGDKIAQTGR